MAKTDLKLNSKNCPTGAFAFAAIIGKGIENTNAKHEAYEYKVTLELDEKTAGPLMDEIDDYIEDNAPRRGELTKVPYQTHDDYDGIPAGKVWIYAKTSTEWEDSKTGEINPRVINVYDSEGDKVTLPENTGIGNGSTGKVFGNMQVWEQGKEYGATIWLTGVQIADFIPYEFEETVVAMEGGSFKGFNKGPQLEKDEAPEEEAPKERTRRSRRDRGGNDEEEEAPKERTRRSRRG